MYKTRIKEKWWFSQCGRTWLVCRKQLNTWCDFKWATNSSPNTNDLYIWVVVLESSKTGATETFILNTLCFHLYCHSLEVPFSLLKKGVSVLLSIHCIQVIGVWWWVFGSFKVTPEVFSCFLQTSQVLPHWLNHHFSLILVLYTETLSC